MSTVATGVPDGPSPLDRGRLRTRLAAGQATLGTFVGSASPVTAEACAAAGVDWLVLDLEHGSGGEEQVRDVIPAAGAYGVPTVVRVESAARIRIGRVLDLGAVGVMLPRMDTAEEVRQAVRHLRYPPVGDRGVATYNRACRFGLDPGALARANAEVLGVVQVESASAVEHVDQIAAIDGVDVLFVGPQDPRPRRPGRSRRGARRPPGTYLPGGGRTGAGGGRPARQGERAARPRRRDRGRPAGRRLDLRGHRL